MRAGGAFHFNGVSQPEVAYKANAIRTNARGVRHVSFPDGQRIEVSYPYYILRGASVPPPQFMYSELPCACFRSRSWTESTKRSQVFS